MAAGFGIILFAIVASLLTARGKDRDVLPFALAGLALHIASAFAQLWIAESYYGGSADIFHFAEYGKAIDRLLTIDFIRFFPEVVKLALHRDSNLQFESFSGGDSTSTMFALTGLLFYAFGTGLTVPYLAASIFGWGGQLLLARTVLPYVRPHERRGALFATLLVPSVVFWSSGVVKEAFMLGGLGLLCYSLERALLQRRIVAIVGVGVGALIVALLKPYVLFPFAVAIAVWFLVARSKGQRKIRWASMALAVLAAIGGILALGAIFPTFSIDRLGEETAQRQEAWSSVGGGSEVDMGGGSTSLASQIPYVPVALVNSLFRPVIFEVRNAMQAIAAVETTVLVVLVGRVVWRVRWAGLRAMVLGDPLLASSLTFVILFSIAVGLTTRNLGSLSRYRMPMVPFYVMSILLLSQRAREHAPAADAQVADAEAS